MLWPIDQHAPGPYATDKLLHLIAFAVLAFPLILTGRLGFFPVLIGTSVLGGIIELIQPYVLRNADINDWAADIFGAILGISLALFCRYLKDQRI